MFLLLIGVGSIFFGINKTPRVGPVGEVHEHADFKVYLNGVVYNFSQEKYMSEGENKLSEVVHLHDLDGEIIHKHAKGVVLGLFFKSLGMSFSQTCFSLDNGTSYCADKENKLFFYVNGKKNKEYEAYELKDLDRILISYGSGDKEVIKKETVTDRSCIFSGSCPERGVPPDESSCLAVDKVCKA